MSKWMFAGCISVAASALLFGGCAMGVDSGDDEPSISDAPASEAQGEIASPDLIPLNDTSDCGGFYVKNVGSLSATATTLRVRYNWKVSGVLVGQTEFFSIPALAPGASHFISYYPEECVDLDGDCDFVMKADSSNVEWEINESNNTLTTHCIFNP